MYLNQLFTVRAIGREYIRFRKVTSAQTIPADEILSQLETKLEKDTNICGPKKFFINDINDKMGRIIENEQQIIHSVNFLKEKQNEIAEFIVNFNTIKSGIDPANNNSDSMMTE